MLIPSPLITMTLAKSSISTRRKHCSSAATIVASRLISVFIINGAVMVGLTGCGQKGDLYLVDNDSQMVSSSEAIDSTSNPQDAAFEGIDDADYQKTRYLEQKQVLPDVTDDPNDY